MAAARSTYIQYMDKIVMTEVEGGSAAISDLPLVAPTKGKRFKEFFQIVRNVSAQDCEAICTAMSQDPISIAALPLSVRPRDALGESCRMQIVIGRETDGSNTVLKFFHSSVFVPVGLAKVFCNHNLLTVDYGTGNNSDAVKKGFLQMLSQIPGKHWLSQRLVSKDKPASSSEGSDGNKNWSPSTDELKRGIAFINEFAPLANSKNEQFLWVLLNIRDTESPICGWPQHVVNRACQNRASGNCQADPEYFFPLLLQDLNRAFQEDILPLVLPLMPSYGLMILGRPGVGKTPASIIMAMAIARHMVAKRDMQSSIPGWRRSKQIDGFRERPGEVHIPVILDDPNLAGINLEDLKSFLDVGENCLVDARYRAAKFVRNQVRVVLNNEWDEEKEPQDAVGAILPWGRFLDMFAAACNHAKLPHIMAILKRSIVIIAGKRAVYLRLPSEHESQVIHRFDSYGVQEDWLKDDNKKYYGNYKDGAPVKYQDYDQKVEEETCKVASLLATAEEKAYIERAATRERWAAAAGTSPIRSGQGKAPQVQLKEELLSPCTKRQRTMGVIDVEDDEAQSGGNWKDSGASPFFPDEDDEAIMQNMQNDEPTA